MSDAPITDIVSGTAHSRESFVWIDDKNVQATLDTYVGCNVRLMLAHLPNQGSPPPFLWSVKGQGLLSQTDGHYLLGDEPFCLSPMVGHRCMFSIVNMDFEIASLEELGLEGGSDIAEIAEREKKLRSAIANLSAALGSLAGDNE